MPGEFLKAGAERFQDLKKAGTATATVLILNFLVLIFVFFGKPLIQSTGKA
jgi:hypothetical protein